MLETEKRFKRPMRILLFGEKGIYELKNVAHCCRFHSMRLPCYKQDVYLIINKMRTFATANQ